MILSNAKINTASANAGPEMEARPSVDSLLESLGDCRLGERITDAARLAFARHMLLTAQSTQSAVEAEDSTK